MRGEKSPGSKNRDRESYFQSNVKTYSAMNLKAATIKI